MTYPGALALTGVGLLFTALILAIAVLAAVHRRTARQIAMVAWPAFSAAVVCLIASAWWEAVTR